jgi:uracil-DNA glycosylase
MFMKSAWPEIQAEIWACTRCQGHERAAVNLRQQTDAPPSDTKLLVISLAPPFVADVKQKTRAASATTSAEDKLRLFLEEASGMGWSDLVKQKVALLHAVKCAIVPTEEGFQNPPPGIVDRCAPVHLAAELGEVQPHAVVTLGQMAYRAFYHAAKTHSGGSSGPELKLSSPPKDARLGGDGHRMMLGGRPVTLFAAPFPSPNPKIAQVAKRRSIDA